MMTRRKKKDKKYEEADKKLTFYFKKPSTASKVYPKIGFPVNTKKKMKYIYL